MYAIGHLEDDKVGSDLFGDQFVARRARSDELRLGGHVDAVDVWETNGRRSRCHVNALSARLTHLRITDSCI